MYQLMCSSKPWLIISADMPNIYICFEHLYISKNDFQNKIQYTKYTCIHTYIHGLVAATTRLNYNCVT